MDGMNDQARTGQVSREIWLEAETGHGKADAIGNGCPLAIILFSLPSSFILETYADPTSLSLPQLIPGGEGPEKAES
jgi:hypothetical protein